MHLQSRQQRSYEPLLLQMFSYPLHCLARVIFSKYQSDHFCLKSFNGSCFLGKAHFSEPTRHHMTWPISLHTALWLAKCAALSPLKWPCLPMDPLDYSSAAQDALLTLGTSALLFSSQRQVPFPLVEGTLPVFIHHRWLWLA